MVEDSALLNVLLIELILVKKGEVEYNNTLGLSAVVATVGMVEDNAVLKLKNAICDSRHVSFRTLVVPATNCRSGMPTHRPAQGRAERTGPQQRKEGPGM